MAVVAEQVVTSVSEGDTALAKVDCSPFLDAGELVSSITGIVEQTTSDLTIENIAVSTAALIILNRSVPIGKAFQFTVRGQQASTTYTMRATFVTDSTPAQTKVVDLTMVVPA